MKRILNSILTVSALFISAAAGGANLTVTSPGVGPETSVACPTGCKLSVNLSGDLETAFVISDEPSSERTFRFGFWMDMNNLVIPPQQTVRIIEVRKDRPEGRILMIVAIYTRFGTPKINFMAYNEAGGLVPVGGFDLRASGAQRFMVNWQAASAPGANDGIVNVAKGPVLKGRTDLDIYLNGTDGVDQVRFGYVARGDASLNGSFFLDNYESYRTLE